MKIARKKIGSSRLAAAGSALLAALLIMHAPYVLAENPTPLVPSAPPVVSSPPSAPTSAVAAAPMPDAMPKIMGADAVSAPPPLPGDADKGEKGLANAEDKVSDSVKNIVKHIGTTDNITLDDLNSAHQAVAKIEALIEVEKHLNELEKLRSEREGKSLASAIPASALSPPLSMLNATANGMNAMPSGMPSPFISNSNVEISRIYGGGGRYSASIKLLDGQSKVVHIGDQVPPLGTVNMITPTSVEFEQNGTKHVLRMKNIDTVFGHTP